MVTKKEFAVAFNELSDVLGVELNTPQMQAYFKRLSDIPSEVFAVACEIVICKHRFPTMPMICEFRKAAAEVMLGEPLPAHDALAACVEWCTRYAHASQEERLERKNNQHKLAIDCWEKCGGTKVFKLSSNGTFTKNFVSTYDEMIREIVDQFLIPQAVRTEAGVVSLNYIYCEPNNKRLLANGE